MKRNQTERPLNNKTPKYLRDHISEKPKVAIVENKNSPPFSPNNFRAATSRRKSRAVLTLVTFTPTPLTPTRFCHPFFRGQELNTNFFFLTLFGHPRDPSKIPGYPAKKVWFPGVSQTFWPPPLHVKDPHPSRRYPDPKVWVYALFSCLIFDPILT